MRPSFIEHLDVVPADATLRSAEAVLAERRWPDRAIRKLLRPLAGDYDLVVLDCPPGLGLLAEAVFGAADLVLTPIVPAPLAIRGLEQTLAFFEANDVDSEILAVLSMVDRRKVLHRQVLGRVESSEHFARTAIPLSDAVERMGLEQMPLSVGVATLSFIGRLRSALGGDPRDARSRLRSHGGTARCQPPEACSATALARAATSSGSMR
ncbi:MAG: ParA family protein [Microthrixaceae bacterium]|nr:ParA family protein [Microthrixaceae bacterium]